MTKRDDEDDMEQLPFHFPPLPGRDESPVWNGSRFRIGDETTAILSYEVGSSGWTDALTTFHEDTAGEDHYIDRASRRHALAELRRWLATDRPAIIDVGCSSGLMLKVLRNEFPRAAILGADYVRGPLETLAQTMPRAPLLQFDPHPVSASPIRASTPWFFSTS